jgi:uncharacterized protein
MNETLIELSVAAGFCAVGIIGHLGYRHRWAFWFFHIILVLMLVACLLFSVLAGLAFIVWNINPHQLAAIPERQLFSLFFLGAASLITTVVGAMALIPGTRPHLFRWLPGSADSPLHRYALIAVLMLLSLNLYMLQSLTPEMIIELLRKQKNFVTSMLTMQGMLMVTTLCGSGLWVSRNFKQVLERLGINKLSPKALGFCILGALSLFVLVAVLEIFILQPYFPVSNRYGEEMARLVKLDEPIWITAPLFLVLSLIVGTGEEAFFRGLLQPVVGMWLSSLLFATIHIQYGFSPLLLVVFGLGLLFGVIRKRYGTTAAILIHGLYDFFNFIHIQLI